MMICQRSAVYRILARASVLATLLAIAGVSTVLAQPMNRAIPASLLKRLGEAADGIRTGSPVFLVAEFAFPHAILGAFGTRAEARTVVPDTALVGVFGPFLTPPDLPPPPERPDFGDLLPPDLVPPTRRGGCVHNAWTSDMHWYSICPNGWGIQSITISILTQAGDRREVTLPPDSIDAVFFSRAAYDKFAMPYYTRVLGVWQAAWMRAWFGSSPPR